MTGLELRIGKDCSTNRATITAHSGYASNPTLFLTFTFKLEGTPTKVFFLQIHSAQLQLQVVFFFLLCHLRLSYRHC